MALKLIAVIAAKALRLNAGLHAFVIDRDLLAQA
jgi:hypothetical protein